MRKASPIDPSRQSLSPWTYSICYAHLLRREGVASLTPHLRDKSCGLRLFRRSARWHNNVVKKAPAAPEPAACPHRSSPPFWAMGKRGYKTERNIAFALLSSFTFPFSSPVSSATNSPQLMSEFTTRSTTVLPNDSTHLQSWEMRRQLMYSFWPTCSCLRRSVLMMRSVARASTMSSANPGLNTDRSFDCQFMSVMAARIPSAVTRSSPFALAVRSATFIKWNFARPDSSEWSSQESYRLLASGVKPRTSGVGCQTSYGNSKSSSSHEVMPPGAGPPVGEFGHVQGL